MVAVVVVRLWWWLWLLDCGCGCHHQRAHISGTHSKGGSHLVIDVIDVMMVVKVG